MSHIENKRMQLLELARQQGGFFTASQAAAIGFDNANQFLLVKDRRWERVRRGIFRLVSEPRGEFDDLHELALFFRHRDGSPSGIFGLETAAAVHGLGYFMPGHITILVLPSFRKQAAIPLGVHLIPTNDLTIQVQKTAGLPLTSPLRTVVDLLRAPDRDAEEIHRAFLSARREGLISPDSLAGMLSWVSDEVIRTILAWENNLQAEFLRSAL